MDSRASEYHQLKSETLAHSILFSNFPKPNPGWRKNFSIVIKINDGHLEFGVKFSQIDSIGLVLRQISSTYLTSGFFESEKLISI